MPTPNEIKKDLYKHKPHAKLLRIEGGKIHYSTTLSKDHLWERIYFEIPLPEIGDTCFGRLMEAQLLIRWLKHE